MPTSRKRRDDPAAPEFLIDRSLGKTQLANSLRGLGYTVHTLESVYGAKAAENIPDERWIEDGAKAGWVLLTKDSGVSYVEIEREAITRMRARVFRLPRADLRGAEQIAIFVQNINRIVQRSRRRGPYVCVVYAAKPYLWQQWPNGQARSRRTSGACGDENLH